MVVIVGIVSIVGVKQVLAYGDPIHCDRFGWPTCYSVGDANGKAAADNDFQSGTGMNLHCGFEHSTNYYLGFRTGYLVQWGVDGLAHGGN